MAPEAGAKAKAKAKGEPKPKKEKKEGGAQDEEMAHIPKPDREAMEVEMAKITEDIEKLQAKKRALDDKIKSRSSGKDEFFRQKGELADKINQFRDKINQLHAQKEELQKGVNDKKDEKNKMAGDLKKMKASIGFKSEEEIDNRIREIEYRLHTDTMPLKQEKDLLKEIQDLKRNRPKVSQVNKMEESLGTFDVGGNFKETLGTINEQIRTWLQEKAKVVDELKTLVEAHQEQLGDLPKEIEERNGIGKKVAEKIQERNKVRDDFREEEKKFQEALRKKRQEQQERIAAERAARAKEYDDRNRQRRVEKLDEQPYMDEITLIEQTIKFCKKLTAGKEKEEKEEKKDIDHGKLDGLVVLGNKDERDEFWFEPIKAKKTKSKAKSAKEGGSAKPIKHNAETFKLFDQLKLDAPITLDDIPPTLEKLESELEKYLEKVKDWEKNKEAKKAAILAGDDNGEEDLGNDKGETKGAETKDEKHVEEEEGTEKEEEKEENAED